MIPFAEVNKIANSFGVLNETIEKDYIISWILCCLSKNNTLKRDFIFYGGTAIKRIYFAEHRYSEDIDLISKSFFAKDKILSSLKECFEYARAKANIILVIQNVIDTKDRLQINVTYEGYNEIVGPPKEIRLDLSMNADIYGKIEAQNIIKSYSDLTDEKAVLNVLTLNTIFANKLGLLSDHTRNEPRDLYDIWFLFENYSYDLEEIKQIHKRKYGFNLTGKRLLSLLDNSSIKENWNIRLEKQISELPPYLTVLNAVKKHIKQEFAEEFNDY